MKVCLDSFLKNLSVLRSFIASTEMDYKIIPEYLKTLSGEDRAKFQGARYMLDRKVFHYNSIIISLYGYWEQFIESMMVAYIERINRLVDNYIDLPVEIQDNHLRLSIELLNRILKNTYSGDVKESDIISRLNSCDSANSTNYELIPEAFHYHTANIRIELLDQLFGQIGVSNLKSRIRGDNIFRKYLEDEFPVTYIKITDSGAYGVLNDLVDRRNEVAHGAPGDIIGNDRLIEYILFFECLAESIYRVAFHGIIPHEMQKNGIILGVPADIFYYNKVIGLKATFEIELNVGDWIATNRAGSIKSSPILNLQQKGIDYRNIELNNGDEVGIKIDHKVFEEDICYLVRQ